MTGRRNLRIAPMTGRNALRLSALTSISVLAALPSTAMGQADEDSAQTSARTTVNEIVVTAQKRAESANDVPMSITAIDSQALQNEGVKNVSDLTRLVPGLTYTPNRFAVPVFTIRGVGFFDASMIAQPAVSVYVDEVPLPLSLMSGGAVLDLERVEVLKGPQGTLFGSNSTGGAINFIAAKPTETTEAGGEFTFGRFGDASLSSFVSGPISATLRGRVAVSVDRRGDWQKSLTRDDKLGEGTKIAGRAQLEWTPSDRLKLNLNVNGWIEDTDNQAWQLTSAFNPSPAVPPEIRAAPVAPDNPRAADWDPDTEFRRHIEFYQISVRGDYELTDSINLTSITAYSHLTRRTTDDIDGTAITNFRVASPGRATVFTQELRLAGELGVSQWLVGANYEKQGGIREDHQVLFTVSSYPFRAANDPIELESDQYAVFGNVDWQFADNVSLQTGIRYTKKNSKYQGCIEDSGAGDLSFLLGLISSARTGTNVVVPPGACVALGQDFFPEVIRINYDEDSVSWRVGLNWDVNPDTLLYANVSQGYKNASFPVSGGIYYVQYLPVKPEKVIAYEAGFKFSLLNRSLQLNGAAFYLDYTKKQIQGKLDDPVIGSLNALVNVPKSRVLGAELQATWVPVPGVTISEGLTYVNSKILGSFINYDGSAQTQELGGQPFPFTPRWQSTTSVEYAIPASPKSEIYVGGNFSYQSKTNSQLGELAIFEIDSYGLLNLRAGVRDPDGRWDVGAFVLNATNELYELAIGNNSRDVRARLVGRPRTFGIKFSYRM